MSKLHSICVCCGSSVGVRPTYAEAARQIGMELAREQIRLVYGGGDVGLMGTVARSVIAHGGSVTGIIPKFLQRRENMLAEVEDLIVTDDMHERKRLMFEHADAFIALPGGVGTLEELVEQLTWAQLGQHKKPIVLANVDGFWTRFLGLLDHMRQEGFIRAETAVDVMVAERPEDIVPMMRRALAGLVDRDLELTVGPDVL